jgi:hypothetical protein
MSKRIEPLGAQKPRARPDHPALRAYYARLTERAAYRAHVMVSYDALRVR